MGETVGRHGKGGVALARASLVVALAAVLAAMSVAVTDAPVWVPVGLAVVGVLAYLVLPKLARSYMTLRRPRWLPLSSAPLAAVDVLAWFVALGLALVSQWDRLDGTPKGAEIAVGFSVTGLVQLVAGAAVGTYRGRWRVGSFGEVGGILASATVTGVVGFGILGATGHGFAAPVLWFGSTAAVILMTLPRGLWRINRDRRSPHSQHAERILLFGAGRGAAAIMPALVEGESPYLPVAMLDDDPAKRFRSINGVRVVGNRSNIRAAAEKFGATSVLIAIPSATSEVIRGLVADIEAHGLRVRVLPRPADLVGGLGVGDIRDVSEADLLGRRMVETDLEAIAGYLSGRRVLVTGAGGSIGSELCRQLWRFNPAELMLLDRDESALHGTLLSMTGKAELDTDMIVLCDIRDRESLRGVFARRRPEVVFHAAALKHVPILERYPLEALKTNVVGTQNVVEVAAEFGVTRFINISTDKAASPANVLGYSKRAAERVTATVAHRTGLPYVSVRFGNVLGSRGSMLITFRDQVERGGPITVTHPDATRYFMMIEEAVQLTIQAGAIGQPGEVLVLDMGRPIRILDVAELLASRAARPIRIEFTGLRAGEKLHEVLFAPGETDSRPFHPSIAHADVPPFGETEADGLCPVSSDHQAARNALIALASWPVATQPAKAEAVRN